MEVLGSHVDGIEQSLAVLEQECRDDRDRVNRLEAHHGDLNQELDTLIDLLSNQFLKIDGVRSPLTSDPV